MTDRYDIKEKDAIEELRNRVKEEIDPELYEDDNLFYRFLKARDFRINDAETMLRKSLEFRKKYDYKNIVKWKLPEVVEKYLPYIKLGHDKEGCVIRYIECGEIDWKGVLSSCPTEEWKKVLGHYIEEDLQHLKTNRMKHNKPGDKILYIANFENFSFSQATDRRLISFCIILINILEENFPESLKVANLINTSVYFKLFFSVLKKFLPVRFLNKLKIYSDESWKTDFLDIIDADVLPVFLGGTRTDPDGNPLCPTLVKRPGKVPEIYFKYKKKSLFSTSSHVQKITLSNFGKHEEKLEVKEPESYLEWEFETKTRDIGFGLFYQIIQGEKRMEELIPIQRIKTDEYTETGTYRCEKAGTYVIIFDNTYSWLRSKKVYYRIKIISPNEQESVLKSCDQ